MLAFASGTALEGQESGLIRGRAFDRDFRAELPGVVLTIQETGVSAESKEDGTYAIPPLAPGVYSIQATRDGYEQETFRDIVVTAGAVRELDVELSSEVVELEEFAFVAEDEPDGSAVQAINLQQELTSFTQAVGSEFLSQIGAGDVGEALTKLVGTTVAGGKDVVVRGLADRYNTVLLNSARVPSSDPDKRSVNVDLFPGSFVETLTNSKTFTPDLPGESTGGSINIILKSMPESFFVKSSVGLGYNTNASENSEFLSYRGGGVGFLGSAAERQIPAFLKNSTASDLPSPVRASSTVVSNRNKAASLLTNAFGTNIKQSPLNFSVSGEIGDRIEFLGGQPLGYLVGFTYSNSYKYDDSGQRGDAVIIGENIVQSGFFEVIEAQQELLAGVQFTAGYDYDDNNRLLATVFANIAAEDLATFQVGPRQLNGPPPPVETIDSLRVREGSVYTERRLQVIQASGRHELEALGDARIEWTASYAESSQDEPDIRFANYAYLRSSARYSGLGSGFSGQPFERIWRASEDTNYNLNLKGMFPLFTNGERPIIELMAGASLDSSGRDYIANNFAYAFGDLNTVPSSGNLDPDDAIELTAGDVVAAIDQSPTVGIDRTFLFRNGADEFYRADQNIAAAYFMVTAALAENLEANFGARVEVTDLFLNRPGVTFNPDDPGGSTIIGIDLETGEPLPPDEVGKSNIEEVNVLPMTSLTWDFAKDMKLRFSASQTVARPSFKELAPVFTRDPLSSVRFVGNVGLRTSSITNIDGRWEWFPAPGDTIGISLFSKRIEDPIELTNAGNLEYFLNDKRAFIYGVEAELQKNLGFLTPALQNWSVGINYARIVSQVAPSDRNRISRSAAGLDTSRRLQGQSDFIFNFNATYDNKDLGLFAGLFLNSVGEQLSAVGGVVNEDQVPDVFLKPRVTLDAVLSKKLGDNWKITFRAENLTNSQDRALFDNGAISFVRNSGVTFKMSLSGEW